MQVPNIIQELSADQQILLCSVVRAKEPSTLYYLKFYINKLAEQMPNTKVIVVTPSAFEAATIEANLSPSDRRNFDIVVDKQLEVYKWLGANKDKEPYWLGRRWLFHALIKDSKVLCFEEQPTENRKQSAKESVTKEQMQHIFRYKKQPVLKSIFEMPENLIYDLSTVHEFGKDQDLVLYKIVYYHNLWPNKKLLTYLENTV